MYPTIWKNKYILYEILKYNHDNHVETVANINHTKVIKYYTDLDFDRYSMDNLVQKGQLEMLKWISYNGGVCTKYVMDNAAANGHLNVIKWLHHNLNQSCTSFALFWAMEEGYIKVVRWLYDNRKNLGYMPNESYYLLGQIKSMAKYYGYFEFVEYMNANP